MNDGGIALAQRIQQAIGQELGVSSWMEIDQARIDQFAVSTGDHQWIHVDTARAALESPLGATIAHGYLTLSMLAPAALEVFVGPWGITQALNYGLDRVRFLAPVKVGSRVRTRIKLIAAEDKGGGRILVTTENSMEIEGKDKPALIAQALAMLMS
ncbi:MAG: MaoC family dehydratase [Rhodocyclaceae bacterium]|nr:MaoC family dehydratase [Rhodocyclaceae bacterium]MBX3669721.1 MaoC family dehydratase [Rhodocyclaceae bacterium]